MEQKIAGRSPRTVDVLDLMVQNREQLNEIEQIVNDMQPSTTWIELCGLYQELRRLGPFMCLARKKQLDDLLGEIRKGRDGDDSQQRNEWGADNA